MVGSQFVRQIAGNDSQYFFSSPVPQALTLSELEIPSSTGDSVFLWNIGAQTWSNPYQYIDGLGWLTSEQPDPGPDGPTISVLGGFFFQDLGAAATWTKTFTLE